MTKKSIWKRIDESESLQTFFIITMIMICITFFFGLVFLGLKLLTWI
jgi:hypothetical protein